MGFFFENFEEKSRNCDWTTQTNLLGEGKLQINGTIWMVFTKKGRWKEVNKYVFLAKSFNYHLNVKNIEYSTYKQYKGG